MNQESIAEIAERLNYHLSKKRWLTSRTSYKELSLAYIYLSSSGTDENAVRNALSHMESASMRIDDGGRGNEYLSSIYKRDRYNDLIGCIIDLHKELGANEKVLDYWRSQFKDEISHEDPNPPKPGEEIYV